MCSNLRTCTLEITQIYRTFLMHLGEPRFIKPGLRSKQKSPLTRPSNSGLRTNRDKFELAQETESIPLTEIYVPAARVTEFIFDNGLATIECPADIRTWVQGRLYHPNY
jgi:hypothetical protein